MYEDCPINFDLSVSLILKGLLIINYILTFFFSMRFNVCISLSKPSLGPTYLVLELEWTLRQGK